MTAHERALRGFNKHFSGDPTLVVRAPGRVNLIGEFTDYNGGHCLPVAIDRGTWVAARARDDDRVQVLAVDLDDARDSFSTAIPIDRLPVPHWANYVRGVFAALGRQGHRHLPGVDLAISGDVPRGAGLSSSASLEVAVGEALRRLFDLDATPLQLALAGQQAEHDYAGCQCGIMDQMASALGKANHALLLNCTSLTATPVPLPADWAIVVIDTRITRGLVESAYNERRRQCVEVAAHFNVNLLCEVVEADFATRSVGMAPLALRRARHVVGEDARTLQAAHAIGNGDLVSLGHLMRASHRSMRDDFEVSLPPIDALVELSNGVIGDTGGARLTGGGFGGSVVAVLPKDGVPDLARAVKLGYRNPSGELAHVHLCSVAAGANLAGALGTG